MGLSFETPIQELNRKLERLKTIGRPETEEQIRDLRQEIASTTANIYDNLTPWQIVQVARHKDRPQTHDYLHLVFDEFVQLHGDKLFGDDSALRTGFAKLEQFKVMVIGHQKGRTTKERTACYFGCAHPEGYRKALSKMKLAAKFNVPIICFIDTPGAYPGVGAEERGQSLAIAENMFEMSRLRVPIICIVIGEGGSGGALGIGVGDRVGMLQFAYYSVISPEGCAGILWKSHEYAERAAAALKFTSPDLLKFGIIDEVIQEPLGGAHRDHHQTASRVKMFLLKSLRELQKLSGDELLDERYDKFRRMGVFLDHAS
ncbi:MAG: acetyl-CoA carboxylase carboxyltransferase subunit alpha [Planctomycetales bacterium]|nr:acetyl-CoA carboxylase carboxyltransferase subunit alpha [Planctomycetales bacterium]